MCFLFSFVPATFWIVIGYIVLFSSTKTDGLVSYFGRLLSFWVFFVATMFIVGGAYMTLTGFCSMETMMQWCSEGRA